MNARACSITTPAAVFLPTDGEVFVRVFYPSLSASDRMIVAWLDPRGVVEQETPYPSLPTRPTACLVSRLSVAGFPPAAKPGAWRVQVWLNDNVAAEKTFRIEAALASTGALITAVRQRELEEGRTGLDLDGSGFSPGSVVHIARLTPGGDWHYLTAELPLQESATRLSLQARALEPGEYIAVVRANDDSVSPPATFVIQTPGAYTLPVPAAESWVITQPPHGSFSHWNRSLNAWDIAPRNGRYVVAMRSGIARTHDMGLHQTPHQHSFGNYITIEHPDGEFSHYAHLATGSFLVHEGERVQQGQPLAVVGNSGYTMGAGRRLPCSCSCYSNAADFSTEYSISVRLPPIHSKGASARVGTGS